MLVKFLNNMPPYRKDEVTDIDEVLANRYILVGICLRQEINKEEKVIEK